MLGGRRQEQLAFLVVPELVLMAYCTAEIVQLRSGLVDREIVIIEDEKSEEFRCPVLHLHGLSMMSLQFCKIEVGRHNTIELFDRMIQKWAVVQL